VSKTVRQALVRRTFVAMSCFVGGAIALAGCGVLRTSNVTASPSPIAVEPIITPSEATSSAAPALAPIAVAPCLEKDLQITDPWEGPPDDGMDVATVAIVFRNSGAQSCSMIGWPTIATPGLKTTIQYATVTQGFVVPVTRVVVPPGSSAAASIDLFAPPGSSDDECGKPGSWAITPPGGDQPTELPWVRFDGACLDGTVIVSPVYAGDMREVGFGSLSPSQVPTLGPFSSPPSEH
jgi:hypothetical protein